jgi:transcriptional regulator with XRE-family HTH domain
MATRTSPKRKLAQDGRRTASNGRAGNGRANNSRLAPARAVADVQRLREDFRISKKAFARALGVSERSLARIEAGGCPIESQMRDRLKRLRRILRKAAAAMRREYIPTWIERASPACAEIGAAAPVDLMERGDYDAVDSLLFYLGSGVAF